MPPPREDDASPGHAARRMNSLTSEDWKVVERVDAKLKTLEQRVVDLGAAVAKKVGMDTLDLVDGIERDIQSALQAPMKGGEAERAIRGRAAHMVGYLEQVRTYCESMGYSRKAAKDPEDVKKLEKKMSKLSVDAMTELDRVQQGIRACEAEMDQIVKDGIAGDAVRTQLSQIEARLNKLEGQNDGVVTAELHAGKEEAKETRRRNVKVLEQLFERIEGLFADNKAAKK